MNKKVFTLSYFIFFSLLSFSQVINLNNSITTVSSYTGKEIIMTGKTELHLTATTKTLVSSTVKLNSEDAWLFFDNVRPQVVIDSLLKYVYVNGSAAVLKTNVRVSIYKHGAVVIPHSSVYKPLKVYTGKNFTGDSASYSLFTFNNSLGATFDNKIKSFKLKRGYMATLANTSDGTGYSRVFIADNKDLEVSEMPTLLNNAISFIRVLDWEWVSKKGWCGTGSGGYTLGNKVNGTWYYTWSADQATRPNLEYVPIRQNGGWPGWSEINSKQYVSQVLGFNEPDHTEQSNLTVSQAVAQWPDMLRTGLRIGSPACTNFSWLYQFMDSCKAKNYRVDYVAVHAYWGGKSPQNWYNDLKYIHDRTGRPIWITEWNNGANWTTEGWPTSDHSLSAANAAKQLADLKAILNVLDTASFIERYSIYNWVQDCRAMVLADTLTPAGKYYAADKAPMAYNSKYEVIPTYIYNAPSLAIGFTTKKLTLTITDPNGDYYNGYIVERKLDGESYSEYARAENTSTKTFLDTLDLNLSSRARYRVRVMYTNGTYSAYTNEVGYDVTDNSDVQFGNISVANIGWNPVLFGNAFTSAPAIITGSPTNYNSSVFMSPRVKLVSYTSRFTLQLAPWSYQKVSTLSKEETAPYFVLAPGSYDFGGLKAVASATAKATSSWMPVTFATPFDTVPVVFASQLNPYNTFATGVRVRNVTKTGFEVKIQKETAVTTAISIETISYLAITKGKGMINGHKVIVGRTVDNFVGATYKTINYGDSIGSPIFLSQMQTCTDDTVTAALRNVIVTNKYANVVKQRERSTGVTTTLNDAVGYMVIDPVGVFNGVDIPAQTSFRLYPNPATDYIIFEKDAKLTDSLIDIYNIYGVLVKRVALENNKIDVRNLPSGSYILKTKNSGTSKFIKM